MEPSLLSWAGRPQLEALMLVSVSWCNTVAFLHRQAGESQMQEFMSLPVNSALASRGPMGLAAVPFHSSDSYNKCIDGASRVILTWET